MALYICFGSVTLGLPGLLRPRFTVDDIQFTPGDRLPSLESLNLTAVDLVEKAFLDLENESSPAVSPLPSQPLNSRQANAGLPYCAASTDRSAYRSAALACADYLEALGNTPCKLWGNPGDAYWGSLFCHITIGGDTYNSAFVEGVSSKPGTGCQESWCRHVAHAVRVTENRNCRSKEIGHVLSLRSGAQISPWSNCKDWRSVKNLDFQMVRMAIWSSDRPRSE